MVKHFSILALCSVFFFACPGSHYIVEDLGVSTRLASSAFNLNSSGTIVGVAYSSSGPKAFRWNGRIMFLPTLGGLSSEASAVNNLRQIVGTAETQDGYYRAVLWEGETILALGTLGGTFSAAWDINDCGQVVGMSLDEKNENHAFIWENGFMEDIIPDFYSSFAFSINNFRQVVGVYQDHLGRGRAFFFERGSLKDIGTLGGDHSYARAVNDRGQVVGAALTPLGYSHAFLWENGEMTDLGTLADDNSSEAVDINNFGQVIGRSSSLGFSLPFIWSKETGMKNLNDLIAGDEGVVLLEALAINDLGQIVGIGTFPRNPNSRAVILKPMMAFSP